MTSTPTHPGERRAQNRPTTRVRFDGYDLRLAVVLLAAAGLCGCQSISMNSAQLRVIDASPDSGVIDSYQNTSALAYNLGFGTITSYVPMSPGAYNLAANKAGTRQTLAVSADTLVAGRQYTEIIGNGLVNMQQTVLVDQSSPAPAGQIAVRLVNEATRTGAVDVYLVPMGGRLVNTMPIALNLSFGSNSGYINIPSGNYAIDVVSTGTTLAASTTTLLSGAQVEYASGAVRTVVLIDQETQGAQHATLSQGVQAIVAADADAQ